MKEANEKTNKDFRPKNVGFTNMTVARAQLLLNNKETHKEIEILPDNIYLKKKGSLAIVTKIIPLKEGVPDEFRVKAFYIPITIIADNEIQKIAYYSGIGQRNSFGFGMLDILRNEKLRMNE